MVRKTTGYVHIPKQFAPLVNTWYHDHVNPHLNFHRQCVFATDKVDARGKIKKEYKSYMTPCEKLLSIPEVEKYLKPGITTETLRATMMEKTHLKSAQDVQAAKKILFDTIRREMLK